MKRKHVREVIVPKVVHEINLPKDVVFIGEEELYNTVDEIMQKQANNDGYIALDKSKLKMVIYDLVIAEFKRRKYYYKGLNLNLILKQVNKLMNKYTLKDNNPMEEYDRLCLLKANGKEYSKKRFNELKRVLFGEDGAGTI